MRIEVLTAENDDGRSLVFFSNPFFSAGIYERRRRAERVLDGRERHGAASKHFRGKTNDWAWRYVRVESIPSFSHRLKEWDFSTWFLFLTAIYLFVYSKSYLTRALPLKCCYCRVTWVSRFDIKQYTHTTSGWVSQSACALSILPAGQSLASQSRTGRITHQICVKRI